MVLDNIDSRAVVEAIAGRRTLSSLVAPGAKTYSAQVRNALAARIWDEADYRTDLLLPAKSPVLLVALRTACFLRSPECVSREAPAVLMSSPQSVRRLANLATAGVLRRFLRPQVDTLPDDTWPFASRAEQAAAIAETAPSVRADLEALGATEPIAALASLEHNES